MGIVSDSDFNSELERYTPSTRNGEAIAIIKEVEKGRGKGNGNVPDALRKVIGEEAAINGRSSAIELADKFGIKPDSVNAYGHGAHSEATYNDRPDLEHINQARIRVAKRARTKLILTLNHITNDKLEAAKVKDLAGVARDMSAVVKNMEPETNKPSEGRGPTFIFYSPQFRNETAFELVHVKE